MRYRVTTALLLISLIATAASGTEYRQPAAPLVDLVDTPARPAARVSPDGRWLATFARSRVQPLERVARHELELAGLRIHPASFSRSRSRTYAGMALHDLREGKRIAIDDLPQGRIDSPSWSSDARFIAFTVAQADRVTLWIHDVQQQQTRRLVAAPLNSVLTSRPFTWLPDASGLLINIAVNHGDSLPQPSTESSVPVIQQAEPDSTAPVRTYQDLLDSPLAGRQFAFLARGQLARVNLEGETTKLGEPALIDDFEPSPDTRYLLVETIERPFSYTVPHYRFASRTEVWNRDGERVKTVARLPLAEDIPKGFDSVRTGRRSVEWRADSAATLVWAEAQDGGDMSVEVDHHDRVFAWSAPFERPPRELLATEWRYAGIDWGNDELAMLIEWRFSDRQVRRWTIAPGLPGQAPVLFDERSYNDEYNDPGSPVHTTGEYGTRIIQTIDGSSILLTGRGASPDGETPFLDCHDFEQQATTRIWASRAPYHERVAAVLDETGQRILTLREAPDVQPNYFVRDLADEALTQVTGFPHPHPELSDIDKQRIDYQRDDGVKLSGTLYLPPGHAPGDGPLPVLIWAYPREYKDPSVAGQVRESPYEFNRIGFRGPMPYLALGYAVFDDPGMPIVGTGERYPNDTFIEQLVASARAGVDALVERDIADPERIAIGGHSYGAFMVANLLAHSDLFAAGIARSGAYNRSLTPFGFQGEERHFWQGKDVYTAVSPFFHADRIDEPLLLMHGMEDDNSGTYPMQSERLFDALKGLGARARLVMLPHESHSYRARASVLNMLWEQQRWLQMHLGRERQQSLGGCCEARRPPRVPTPTPGCRRPSDSSPDAEAGSACRDGKQDRRTEGSVTRGLQRSGR